VSRGTRDTARGFGSSRTGLSPSLAGRSRPLRLDPQTPTARSHNPDPASRIGLGCSPFAHRYLGNRGCFLFLRVLRCFSSPGWRPLARIRGLTPPRVAPFGDPGITACVRLPRAYRSLPRPSSPPRAKASTVRLFALDLITRVVLRLDSSTPRHLASIVKERSKVASGESRVARHDSARFLAPRRPAPAVGVTSEKCRTRVGDSRGVSAASAAGGLLRAPERR
jgi:hypothetical protein